jgi:hypothetical protein
MKRKSASKAKNCLDPQIPLAGFLKDLERELPPFFGGLIRASKS